MDVMNETMLISPDDFGIQDRFMAMFGRIEALQVRYMYVNHSDFTTRLHERPLTIFLRPAS